MDSHRPCVSARLYARQAREQQMSKQLEDPCRGGRSMRAFASVPTLDPKALRPRIGSVLRTASDWLGVLARDRDLGRRTERRGFRPMVVPVAINSPKEVPSVWV